jgi:GDP-4-dehydro-6-deoxy-D-mannose reductase
MRIVVDRGTPGEATNIGRGSPVKIHEVLDALLGESRAKVEVRTVAERLRPADEPTLYPDVTRLRALGFAPAFSLKDTLSDVLQFWRSQPNLIPKEAWAR